MAVFFLLARILTGVGVSFSLALLLLIIFFHSAVNFAKEGAGVLGYVVSLFTSGFTKGTRPPDPQGWIVNWAQVGLAAVLVAMLVSVFLPHVRMFLHVVAALGVMVLIWFGRMVWSGPELEVICLPWFPVWYVYYALCLTWWAKQPAV